MLQLTLHPSFCDWYRSRYKRKSRVIPIPFNARCETGLFDTFRLTLHEIITHKKDLLFFKPLHKVSYTYQKEIINCAMKHVSANRFRSKANKKAVCSLNLQLQRFMTTLLQRFLRFMVPYPSTINSLNHKCNAPEGLQCNFCCAGYL